MTRVLVVVGLAVLALVIVPLGVWGTLVVVAEARPLHDERAFAAPPGGVVVHAADVAVTLVPSRDAAVHVITAGTYALTRPSMSVAPDGATDPTGDPSALGVSVSSCLRCEVTITVAAPPSATVGVDGAAESITAVGVDSPLRLSAGRAPVTARDLGSPRVVADTGRGDIVLALRRPAAVTASTGSGNITVTAPPTAAYSLDPQSGSGTVLATLPDAPGSPFHLSARTGRGDITLSP